MFSNISRPSDLRKPWNLAEMKGTTHDSLWLHYTYCNILKTHNLRSNWKGPKEKCLSRFVRDINLDAHENEQKGSVNYMFKDTESEMVYLHRQTLRDGRLYEVGGRVGWVKKWHVSRVGTTWNKKKGSVKVWATCSKSQNLASCTRSVKICVTHEC